MRSTDRFERETKERVGILVWYFYILWQCGHVTDRPVDSHSYIRLLVWRIIKIKEASNELFYMTTVDPCKQIACKLQKCLKDNVYQPSRCSEVLEEIRKCCLKHSSNSAVCDGINTTRPYQHNTVDYRKALR